ncbi:MAG: type II secretion system F family protein [Alphaproteobacteria bacterium]|nr:type II secretion system F family protein [Alphaproteobacteria bacterium]
MNLFPLIVGLVVLFLVFLVTAVAMMGAEKKRKQRMLAMIRGQSSELRRVDEKDAHNKRREEIARKLKETGDDEKGKKKKATIGVQLEQAGMSISVKQYWTFSAVAGLILMGLAQLLGASIFVVLMMGVIGLLGLPKFVLRFKTKRRQKKFLEEFADALEAMVRLLKAGMPVTEAISMCAKEFGGPVGEEMSRVYDSQKIGVPLPEAVLESAHRMPLTEMQMFATGIAIQAQTGASLSEVLLNLAGVIRARFRLRRKVDALSSEAKASAMIIGSLPFLVGGGLFAINPEYIGLMFDTTIGRVLMIGSAMWMGIGIMIMKIMINFKV